MKINLMEDSLTEEEFNAISEVLKSGMYTQGKLVDDFEKKFAEWNGSKYAVMVNSGSSADLLIISLLKYKYNLKETDEIIVPAITWPTTIFPIIQNNIVPIFCDVDASFNLDLESIKRMKTSNTKAIFAVHALGQPANMLEIKKYCDENSLMLVEDCCESTGATINGIKVGNFGIMGSFSFYFGHHMTTIEGGMIVTNDHEIYDLLKSLRSHGWTRGSERINKYPEFKDHNFVFDLLGYNVRSTNLNAAIGLVQLRKLDKFIQIRKENHKYFLEKLSELNLTSQKVNLNETTSFCLPIIFSNKGQRDFILGNLKMHGVECRTIIAGNLTKQPVFENTPIKRDGLPMANKFHDVGLYIPNNQFITKEKIDYMLNAIVSLSKEFDEVHKSL